MKYTLEIPVLVLSSIPSASIRLTVASLYTLPVVVLKSSERATDANRTAKITTVVPKHFMRPDSAVFRPHPATTKYQRYVRRVICAVCHAVTLTLELFVVTALCAVEESIEVPFSRRLGEHFFALQTIFGVLHVRFGDVCLGRGQS